jgi:hypothetical protein
MRKSNRKLNRKSNRKLNRKSNRKPNVLKKRGGNDDIFLYRIDNIGVNIEPTMIGKMVPVEYMEVTIDQVTGENLEEPYRTVPIKWAWELEEYTGTFPGEEDFNFELLNFISENYSRGATGRMIMYGQTVIKKIENDSITGYVLKPHIRGENGETPDKSPLNKYYVLQMLKNGDKKFFRYVAEKNLQNPDIREWISTPVELFFKKFKDEILKLMSDKNLKLQKEIDEKTKEKTESDNEMTQLNSMMVNVKNGMFGKEIQSR